MSFLEAAKLWLAQDPDHETRSELEYLIAENNELELAKRFSSRIGFGTAGLRGELGAGPNRMNRVLVGQAAAGIVNWLKSESEFKTENLSIVIGFDGRINSDVFARDSAQIFAAAGIRVVLFEDYVPTPVLAFAVKHGKFSMGVMVTASHNPPRDNGYKVYLGGSNGGSQIIGPVDKQISAHIESVAANVTFDEIAKSNDYEVGGAELLESYLAQTAQLVDLDLERAQLKTVYSAMHGVGFETLKALYQRVGFDLPEIVSEQIAPNGNFPTVAFPNPEEPGALDLTLALATKSNAQLAIVTDPDADRLAVAIPQADGWRKLTGDEIGLLLGADVAERFSATGFGPAKPVLACSIASSSALGEVAKHFGLGFVQTLTGFKWIAKVENLAFGYEEALGYCVDPEHTPDKDGISAALLVSDLAARLNAQGKTIADRLTELGNQFGHFANGQVSLRFEDVAKAQEIVARLRQSPPTHLGNQSLQFVDLKNGLDGLAATDAIRFILTNGSKVLIRPSGTEPKLKCYLEVKADSAVEAQEQLKALGAEVKALLN